VTRALQSWYARRRYGHPAVGDALRHQRDLCALQDRTSRIKPSDLLVFIVCRNEKTRLPFFLDYYRHLGVAHFLFVDNGSDDGTTDFLRTEADCSIWTTAASYRDAKFGVHWLNALLRRYGTGHWCLTLDPDEFLVIPYHDSRKLPDLTDFLDSRGKDSFFSLLLDMYPQGPVEEAIYAESQDPLEVAPWFDPAGYYQEKMPQCQDWWIRGGVRRRVFFADAPADAPALNKTVLVRWKKHYAYLSSTHVLAPARLNDAHFSGQLCPTGCLLHFKYLALFKDKVSEEMQRRQHYAGSREYGRYHEMFRKHDTLWCSGSTRYEGWHQLRDYGLLNTGTWF
jgi:hypothetical protein